MRKVILTVALAFLITLRAPVYAYEDFVLSDEQKIQVTASMIGELMDLISKEFLYEISVEQLYEAAVRGMIGELGDYSEYYSVDDFEIFFQDITAQTYGIGVYIDKPDNGPAMIYEVIPGDPADHAGILKGDIILAVNGIDVGGMVLNQISALIKDKYRDTVVLDIERSGEAFTIEVVKAMITRATARSVKFEDYIELARGKDNSQFGYIIIDQISESTTQELEQIIADYQNSGVTGVVLDFRDNGGGQLNPTIDICKLLVPKGPIVHTTNKSGKNITYSSDLEKPPFENIIVLAGRDTASAAEIIVAALQDSEAAIVVGEKTYGKGLVQSLLPLSLGDAVKFTTAEYYRRNGARVDGVGVKPNILIETPEFTPESDITLEAAYRLLVTE